jgi:hypothetical protein
MVLLFNDNFVFPFYWNVLAWEMVLLSGKKNLQVSIGDTQVSCFLHDDLR